LLLHNNPPSWLFAVTRLKCDNLSYELSGVVIQPAELQYGLHWSNGL
jgi:hypothetical protein